MQARGERGDATNCTTDCLPSAPIAKEVANRGWKPEVVPISVPAREVNPLFQILRFLS